MSTLSPESGVKLGSVGQITECVLCLDTLKTPKALPCIHTFCLDCLLKYGSGKTDGSEMPCPLCRQNFTIPTGGFEKLPTNFFIQELIDRSTTQATVSPSHELTCDMCSSDVSNDVSSSPAVTKYCVECDQNMCERCAVPHTKGRYTKDHKVISTEDKLGSQVSMTSKARYNCEKHADKALDLYCYDCKMTLCLTCRTLDHMTHPCADLKQASLMFAGKIEKKLPQLTWCTEILQDEQHKLDKNEENLLEEIKATEQSMSDAYSALIEVINAQRDELQNELNLFKNERLKAIHVRKEEVQRQSLIIESFKKYSEELIEHGAAYDILRCSGDIIARADVLVKSQEKFDVGKLIENHVTFTTADIPDILKGRTPLIGHVAKLCDTKGSAALLNRATVINILQKQNSDIRSIATLGSQLFLVRYESKQIEIYNKSDLSKTGQVNVKDMKDPRFLAACQHHNCLYISDCELKLIHRVELSDSSLTKWSARSEPVGLSLTRAHNLLVTLPWTQRMQEYTTRGLLMREIKLDDSIDLPWHSIELSTGQFVVCHVGSQQHRVCIVDIQGRIVTSYGGPRGSAEGQLSYPYCLTVDTSDQIFVSDCNNHKVRLLNPSLSHLGDVTLPALQLSSPMRLHFDQLTGRLYICESNDGGGRLLVVTVV